MNQPLFPGILYDAARRLGQDHAAPAAAPGGQVLAEMGWPAVLIPEALGGAGGGLGDLAAIIEGLAPHGVGLPLIEHCAIAPILLLAAAGEQAGARWLGDLAGGAARIAPLLPVQGFASARPTARATSAGYEMHGVLEGVDLSADPTHCLLLADMAGAEGAGVALFVVAAQALPGPKRSFTTMDGRRCVDIDLGGLQLASAARVAAGASVDQAIRAAERMAIAMNCVDTVATLGAVIEQTAAYLNGRVQFGVALSSFQVLRHRLVDMYIRYEAGRGMVAQCLRQAEAAGTFDERQLLLMKLAMGEIGRFAAEGAIQLHGGMGMSEEVPAARLAQRLLANEFRFIDRLACSARLPIVPAAEVA